MVDLVLEAHGQKIALGLVLHEVAVEVRGVDDDVARALDVNGDARERQAALGERAHRTVCLHNLGVDEHVGVLAAALVGVVAVHDHHADHLADLGRRKAAAIGLVHIFEHALGELADVGVDLLHGLADLRQAWVRSKQNVLLGAHGSPHAYSSRAGARRRCSQSIIIPARGASATKPRESAQLGRRTRQERWPRKAGGAPGTARACRRHPRQWRA